MFTAFLPPYLPVYSDRGSKDCEIQSIIQHVSISITMYLNYIFPVRGLQECQTAKDAILKHGRLNTHIIAYTVPVCLTDKMDSL